MAKNRILKNTAIVVAITKDNIIGINGKLPFYIPEDLSYFKLLTTNNVVIMGKNTFESIGSKPLPNRRNIIVSRTLNDKDYNFKYKAIQPSISDALDKISTLKDCQGKVRFFIGGSGIYKEALTFVESLYVTHVDIDVSKLVELHNNKNTNTQEKSIVISNEDTYTNYKKYLDNAKVNIDDMQLTYFPTLNLNDKYQLTDMGFAKDYELKQKDFSSIHSYTFTRYVRV